MQMSNNGLNSNAANGRNSAKSSTKATATSIQQKNIKIGQNITATTTTTPTIISASATKTNNNDLNIIGGVVSSTTGSSTTTTTATTTTSIATATHRRDNSSFSSGGIIAGHLKRDVQLFHYEKPQRLAKKPNIAINQSKSDELSTTNSSDCKNDDTTASLEPTTLVYYDGNLIAGTLEALIEHMVPTCDYYPERTYIFAFLLSARLFLKPHELLAQISNTWEFQQQQAAAASITTAGIDVVDEATPSTNLSISHATVLVVSASPLAQRKNIEALKCAVVEAQQHKMPRTPMQKSAQNCIRLLAEWIETFPYDFRDERLMQQVRILARKCVFIDNSLGKQVSRILQMLVQRLTTLEKYEEFLQTLATNELSNVGANNAYQYLNSNSGSNSSSSHHTINVNFSTTASQQQQQHTINKTGALNHANDFVRNSSACSNATSSHNAINSSNIIGGGGNCGEHDVIGIMDICSSCAQLAHQLTTIELERSSHIGPEEFVQSFVKDCQQTSSCNLSSSPSASLTTANMSSSLHDMKKTRNLESYVEWFNRLSYLTASEIVKYPKKKQRVRIIEYWIETARECFNIGNFNSLMAIIAGLNLEPISRLKKTWSKVQSAKFSVLEHQMDPTSNFNSYRSTLKAAMWRSEGATDERERIIIPFFSLFVKDLYFLNEGCSNRLPNNHINFEKCSQLAKQIMDFNEWKKVKCPFKKLPNVIAYLQNIPILNESTLSMASFECEPPENTEEKGRYKTVKAETKQQLLQQLQEQQLQQQQQH